MPWTDERERFVVPDGMTEAEAYMVRRLLQIMARLDVMDKKLDEALRLLRMPQERIVGDK